MGYNSKYTGAQVEEILDNTKSYSANDILTKLETIDGEGSGLDADKLDGVELNGLFTDASSSSSTNLSITIGGVTKTITSLYAHRTDIFRRVASATSDNNYDLNNLKSGMAYSYVSSNYLLNRPSGMSYGQVVALNSGSSGALCGQLAWDVNHGSTTNVTRRLWWRAGDSSNGFTYSQWKQIAFTESNVASATKLETARTIWGQNFDGTGNVSGTIYVTNSDATTTVEDSGKIKFNSLNTRDDYRSPYIQAIHQGNYSRKRLSIFQSNATNYTDDFVEVFTVLPNGNVGIGTTNPAYKLYVNGDIHTSGTLTQGSDIRLKDINKDILLSIEDIANAPLFEFTYKSDEDKRIHVGTSAQYWIERNNWFCKKQKNGYYDMEIQNLALASAISIAKEFKNYKEETESTIDKMKKEIEELKQIILNINK